MGELRALVRDGADPDVVVAIWLLLLCDLAAGPDLDRQQRRLMRREYRELAPDADTVAAVARIWQTWVSLAPACPQ